MSSSEGAEMENSDTKLPHARVKAGLLKTMPPPPGADPGNPQKKPQKAGAIAVRFVKTDVISGTGAMIMHEYGNLNCTKPEYDCLHTLIAGCQP